MNDESLKRGNDLKSQLRMIKGYIATLDDAIKHNRPVELRSGTGTLIAPFPKALENMVKILLKSAYQAELEFMQKEFDNLSQTERW